MWQEHNWLLFCFCFYTVLTVQNLEIKSKPPKSTACIFLVIKGLSFFFQQNLIYQFNPFNPDF